MPHIICTLVMEIFKTTKREINFTIPVHCTICNYMYLYLWNLELVFIKNNNHAASLLLNQQRTIHPLHLGLHIHFWNSILYIYIVTFNHKHIRKFAFVKH